MRPALIVLLTLSFCSVTAQNNRLVQHVLQNSKEINLNESDFKQFTFLDTLLKDKRIVLLGESSHGTEEYSQLKLRLIRYLHEQLHFNVLLFESPFVPSSYVNLARDTASAASLLRNSIQSIWHTETVLQVFDYIKSNKISFGGFDPQYIPSPYHQQFITHAFTGSFQIKNSLLYLDRRIDETFHNSKLHLALRDSFSLAYSEIAASLSKMNLSPLQQLVKQQAVSNSSYYKNLRKGNTRDSLMAKNFMWLADSLHANGKIMVWAHNAHIDKDAKSNSRFMGKLLSEHYKEQMYVIGLYMANGKTALNNRTVIDVKKPTNGSLEDLLSGTGFKVSFVATRSDFFNRKLATLHGGKDKQSLNLSKSYDAVFFINGVHPPVYLK